MSNRSGLSLAILAWAAALTVALWNRHAHPNAAAGTTAPATAASSAVAAAATNAATTAASPSAAPDEKLASLRAAYSAAHPPPAAPAAEDSFVVALETGALDTRRSDPASWSRSSGAAPALRAPAAATIAARGTVPLIVQFSGPVREEWKQALVRAGGVLRGYVPQHAFVVEWPAGRQAEAAALPEVQWVGVYEPGYKLQPWLQQLAADSAAPVTVTLITFDPLDVPAVGGVLARLRGAEVLAQAAAPREGLVRARVPAAAVADLAQIPEVRWVEEYVPAQLMNDFAARTNHLNVVPAWTNHGLSGAGQIVGHADTGLDIGSTNGIHPDFAGRVLAAYALGRAGDWSDPEGHGTHTAGSVLGSGAASAGQFRGMAWEAQLVHQSIGDANGNLVGIPADLNVLFYQTYTNGARIHTDSWGANVSGQYTANSRACDTFMWDHPDMLILFSAGNNGVDTSSPFGVVDPDSLGAPATAKNVLTVGAAENDRAPGAGGYSSYKWGQGWPTRYFTEPVKSDYLSQSADGVHQGMAAFSSRGPTDDGRIKPDVVGPGTDVISCRPRRASGTEWGPYPGNTNYMFSGGTSMSTPLVAGCAALFRQYLVERAGIAHPSAALLKAVLINGARSLAPGQYGTGAAQELPPRPSSVEGWGQVNVDGTLFPDAPACRAYLDGRTPLATGDRTDHRFYARDTQPVRVTLAWSDYPSTLGAAVNLVNDLDLTVIHDATTNFPNRGTQADRRNNVEGVDFTPAAPGFVTVRVEGYNVPSGPQPYALVLSGDIETAPVLRHTPLENQFETNGAYAVEALVSADTPVDTNHLCLYWNTTGSHDTFLAGALALVSNALYRGWIPAQPLGTRVYYYLAAATNSFNVTAPADAPASLFSFEVTPPFALTVSGAPSEYGAVVPPYGAGQMASGALVQASAEAFADQGGGNRQACRGWTGTGSVPGTGVSNALQFTALEASSLQWNWQPQYALVQFSTPSGVLQATTWWDAGATGATVAASFTNRVAGTNLAFCGWYVDGLRVSNATGAAANPAAGIAMGAPHAAEARYLPAAQDSDGQGLPDWWQLRYYGSLGHAPAADDDGDGFSNGTEYGDETDPRDPGSFPTAPVVVHTPLASPQTSPAPWRVEAQVTNSTHVASVALRWQRNGGAWTQAVLAAVSNTTYGGWIPAPGTDGDTFSYAVVAADLGGLTATAGPYQVEVRYAVAAASPANLGFIAWPDHGQTNLTLTILNNGSTPLAWQASAAAAGFADDVEAGAGGWTHSGSNDVWHIVTDRCASVSHAWHFGAGRGGVYPDFAKAGLVSPPILLGAGAALSFRHWLNSEFYGGAYYWDGALVELSTNGGVSFLQIAPDGGYPSLIYGSSESPWPGNTPCFGGRGTGWSDVRFDLAAYTGREVRVRLHFGSDGSTVYEGWYVDDIRVTPATGGADLLSLAATSGVIQAHAQTNVQVTFDTSALAPAESRSGFVRIRHNDPGAGDLLVPYTLHNLSRAVDVSVAGGGTVTPAGRVLLRLAGEGTNFLVAADAGHRIAALSTNAQPIGLPFDATATNVAWNHVVSNGTLSAVFDADTSTNGATAAWLMAHGLTNGTVDALAMQDPDGDGAPNWQEQAALTDPNDANDALRISVRCAPGVAGTIVEWPGRAERSYTVHWSTNLLAAGEPLPGEIAGPQGGVTDAVHAASDRIYYRVEVAHVPAVYSLNAAGRVSVSVPGSNGLTIAAMPFVASDYRAASVVGTAGKANPSAGVADNIQMLDPATNVARYLSLYLRTLADGTNHWIDFTSGPQFEATNRYLPPGVGFWYRNRQPTNFTLRFTGDVVAQPYVTNTMRAGALHLLGYPYDARVPVNGAGLTNGRAHFQAGAADNLMLWDATRNPPGYINLYLRNLGGSNVWLTFPVQTMPTNLYLEPGIGFWYLNRSTNDWQWVVPRPYAP